MSEKKAAPQGIWGNDSVDVSLGDENDRPTWSETEEKTLLRKYEI